MIFKQICVSDASATRTMCIIITTIDVISFKSYTISCDIIRRKKRKYIKRKDFIEIKWIFIKLITKTMKKHAYLAL
jgi:hypothetical protein